MLIKNRKHLALNPLRTQALNILEAGLVSIDTRLVLKESLKVNGDFLFIKDKPYDLSRYRKIFLVAFGKDSSTAASTITELLGDRLNGGLVLSQKATRITGMKVFKCTHPATSDANVRATKQVIELLKRLTEEDLLLVVISGGGSAMLSAPYKISANQKARIAEIMMDSGANIEELNTVRKHLSEIKAGRFAALAYPATVLALVFSDVVGNDLSTIASGPTVLDHTTNEDTEKILKKYRVLEKLGVSNLDLNESPKESKFFHRVEHFLLLDNSVAVTAMEKAAAAHGFSPRVLSKSLEGNADQVGKLLLRQAREGEALIAAGETTVLVKGTGVGGRNQELVLANLKDIKQGQLLASIGTDGYDNSPYAGALGDRETVKKARQKKLDIEKFLANNDSYHFFQVVGDGIETGKLESNVADLMLVLTT